MTPQAPRPRPQEPGAHQPVPARTGQDGAGTDRRRRCHRSGGLRSGDLRSAATARAGQDEGEQGFALLLAIFVILIVGSLSIALAGIMLNQIKPTQFARKTTRTISTAEAGLQVALQNLRTATDIAGAGSLGALPCQSAAAAFAAAGQSPVAADGARFTGAVSAGPGGLSYATSLAYYSQDPTGQSLTWLAGHAQACPLAAVPAYAYLQTTGLGGNVAGLALTSGNRVEHATYQFKTSNTNAVGGRVKEFGSAPLMCMQVSLPAVAGATATMQPCLAIGTPAQTWQYRSDLTLYYGGDPTLNLCLQAAANGSQPALATCRSNTGVVFAVNSPLPGTYPYGAGTPLMSQEWGFNDNGHWSVALADGTVTNGTGGSCLQGAGTTDTAQAAAGTLIINTACSANTTGFTAWNPDPQVGAGKAGGITTGLPAAPTFQFVNYNEFGRCLDITGQNVNADHLIDYPCKQAPNSALLTFNQVWHFTSVSAPFGTMSVTQGGTRYCLQAPASGNLVTTKACTSAGAQLWQPTGVVAGDYQDSYHLVSQQGGLCLAADPAGAVTFGSSNITVEPCSAALRQKWNAPPTSPASGLGNIAEDNGAGGCGPAHGGPARWAGRAKVVGMTRSRSHPGRAAAHAAPAPQRRPR